MFMTGEGELFFDVAALLTASALGAWIVMLLRKASDLKKDMVSRKADLDAARLEAAGLRKEVERRDAFLTKSFTALSEIEDNPSRLRDLVAETCQSNGIPFGALVYRDGASGGVSHHSFPGDFIQPDKFLQWMEAAYFSDPEAAKSPNPVNETIWKSMGREGEAVPGNAYSIPIYHRGILVGAFCFATESAGSMKLREADIVRSVNVCSALIAYGILQAEMSQSVEEAGVVAGILVELAHMTQMDKVMEGIHRFLSDNFPQTNIVILMHEEGRNPEPRAGKLLEEGLVRKALPQLVEDFRQGKQVLYFPDAISLMKKFGLPGKPEAVQSLLVAPLSAGGEPFGYFVLESKKPNSLKKNRLSILIRLIQIVSFLLKKFDFFHKEILGCRIQMEHLRGEVSRLTGELQDREATIKELSDYNAIFGLIHSMRSHLATLKGFHHLLENNLKSAAPANYDPVLFRNCQVEVEKMERNVKKFEMVRVVTDPAFPVHLVDADCRDVLGGVMLGLRNRALLKHVEMEINLELPLPKVRMDTELTANAAAQFFDRILDCVSEGKLKCYSVLKDDRAQVLVKFAPLEADRGGYAATWFDDQFRREFVYVVLSRVMDRQDGRLDMEIHNERGFLMAMAFPCVKG